MPFAPTEFVRGTIPNVAGDSVLYTVPTGKVAVITRVQVMPTSDLSRLFLYLNDTSTILSYGQGVPQRAGATAHEHAGGKVWRGLWVMYASETIRGTHDPFSLNPNTWIKVDGHLGDAGDALAGYGEPVRTAYTSLSTTETTAVAVPTGKRYIARTFMVGNLTGGQVSYCWRHRGQTHLSAYDALVGAYDVAQQDVSVALQAGDNLSIQARTANALRGSVHGFVIPA